MTGRHSKKYRSDKKRLTFKVNLPGISMPYGQLLSDFIKDLQSRQDAYDENLSVRIHTAEGYDGIEMKLSYERQETDYEFERRLAKELKDKVKSEKSERATYERLKKKFEKDRFE